MTSATQGVGQIRSSEQEKLLNFDAASAYTPRGSEAQPQSKVNNRYLITAFLSAITCALGSTCRGVASDTPYTSKFLLSFCYLVLSSCTLLFLKF